MSATLVWLRDDLRLDDNPALAEAAALHQPLTVVYVLDEESPGIRPLGGAVKWWLHHSLAGLAAALEATGSRLVLRRGPAARVIQDLAVETSADALLWNRRYGGPERAVDAGLKSWAGGEGLNATSFQANLMFEPWTVRTGSGGPYKVFTPFWKACLAGAEPRQPLAAPDQLPGPARTRSGGLPASETLESWGLLPRSPDWSPGLADTWTPGEAGALSRLEDFVDGPAAEYGTGRDVPGVEGTSRLSPHLRFGEISPFRIWHTLRAQLCGGGAGRRRDLPFRTWLAGILLAAAVRESGSGDTELPAGVRPLQWQPASGDELEAWQQGRTGYPMVDAGMRQLWQTGWMHNRVRMAAASFLVKNLLADWRLGEAWFWDTLVDADAASNPANWQWVAGSGADASPYFRIFNPVTQSKKFDAAGRYLRGYIPELAALDDKAVHEPWKADSAAPGYPAPIVDLAESRARALATYQRLKDG